MLETLGAGAPASTGACIEDSSRGATRWLTSIATPTPESLARGPSSPGGTTALGFVRRASPRVRHAWQVRGPVGHDVGGISMVHQGRIDNAAALCRALELRGRTDVEPGQVVAELLSCALDRGFGLEEGLRRTAARLDGSFAIVAMSGRAPGRLGVVRRDEPLLIGQLRGGGGSLIASDPTCLLARADAVVSLASDEVGIVAATQVVAYDEVGARLGQVLPSDDRDATPHRCR